MTQKLTLNDLRQKIKDWTGRPPGLSPNPVLGEGNPKAKIVFVGEAPGQREDEQGRPFVGPAGKFLDELLGSIGLKREDVYITNVVKFRPPENRDPTPEEKEACLPWLKLELALIKPSVIVPLGRHALGQFFTDITITAAHGKPHILSPKLAVFPIYHPAAALHNGALREALFQDFSSLKAFLDARAKAKPAATAKLKAKPKKRDYRDDD